MRGRGDVVLRGAWALAVLGACSFERGVAPQLPLDATATDTPPVMPDAGPGAWGVPVELAELTSGTGEDDPSLTGDLLEIYFGSRRDGGAGLEDIWRATRTSPSEPWSTPVNVSELNTGATETTAKVTPNGLAIFFASTRGGNADLYVATRTTRNDPWSTPLRVDALSSPDGDWAPAPRADLLRVIWCAGPDVPDEALWLATRANVNAMWGPPVRVAELDEPDISECDPMEPNDRAVYFASDRNGTYDIYRAAHLSEAEPYGPLAPISTVNVSGSDDRDPWVSADERYLVFASNRSGIDRLYVSTR